MDHDEENPPPPPDNNNNNNPRNNNNTNPNTNLNNDQFSHLRTLYQLQNMLTRQLMQTQQPSSNNNNNINNNDNNNNPEHVSINMNNNDNNVNNNIDNNSNNIGPSGETIAAQGIDGTRIDLQLLTSWIEQSFPFVILLLIIWIYQHRNGILIFIWAMAIFMNANQTVKRQVALKDKRSVPILAGLAGLLVFHVLFAYFFFRKEELWRYLISLPPRSHLVIWDIFWVIVLNDFAVRFITIAVKCVVIIMVGQISPHKRNTQLYSVIELASNAYRTVLPISLWFKYMFKAHEVLTSLVSLLYLLVKFTSLYEKSIMFFKALRSYWLKEVQYGKYATTEQVAQAGSQCTICQETMSDPIVLNCNHIFCEDCVSAWFEREKTCPLCRANIPTAGTRSHSDGTTSLLIQLF